MYLAIDTETGGLSTDYSLLSAYFAILDNDLNVVDELEGLLAPNDGKFVVSGSALRVNKINIMQHAEKAITYDKFSSLLAKFLGNSIFKRLTECVKHCSDRSGFEVEPFVLFGKNINFDWNFISRYLNTGHLLDYGSSDDDDYFGGCDNRQVYLRGECAIKDVISHRKMDISSVARFLVDLGKLPKDCNCGLSDLNKHFGLGDVSHDAKSDVLNTVDIYKKMMALAKEN